MSKLFSATSLALLLFGFTVNSNAYLVDTTIGGKIIPAPLSVYDDNPGAESNTYMLGFNERQGYLLGDGVGIEVDGGFVYGSGDNYKIDSHMIFLNTVGSQRLDLDVDWTFSGTILGVMSDIGGTLEAQSNPLLGASGTTYPGSFRNRGFESNDYYSGIGTSTLSAHMVVTEPGDWIRVITLHNSEFEPVPEPATMLLFGTGLAGLIGTRVRRKKNK